MTDTVDAAFLRASELFESQPEEILQAIIAVGAFEDYGPGQLVVRQGDPGDRLYIVKEGVLEIVAARADGADATAVAYLGRGEVVGELALLTGSPRSASIRSPEHAQLFTLDKSTFVDLMEMLPTFTRSLCILLARRLEATNLKAPRAAPKQLQGNLRFFDLATVIQTLISSHQTGSLLVTQDGGRAKVAEIFFFKGNVSRAKVRHLTGDDAVFQLFQTRLEGEFSFTGRPVTEEEVHSDVTMPAISLLMESVRLQDELALLQERIPDPDDAYVQKAPQLRWDDTETVELAAAVWSRLKKGASVNDLQREIPRCTYFIYKTLAAMLEAGMAARG